MPTNQQRREAAKRKLQRQLVRREEIRARRRRTTIIAGTAAVLLVAAGVTWLIVSNKGNDTASSVDTSSAEVSLSEPTEPATPCTYNESEYQPVKPSTRPTNLSPANTGTVDAVVKLGGQDITVTLDRASAPCSVNSFLSLASQGYYDDTSCSRLTKSAELNILQCGDAAGDGTGQPGYTYAPTTAEKTAYPVGTVAMGNVQGQTGANEGAQFFIVYGKTTIPADYSVIGKVAGDGMKAIDAIAAKGVTGGQQDGKPVAEAKVDSITVPAEAVAASTVWATPSAESDTLPTDGMPTEQVPTEEPPSEDVPSEEPPSEEPPSGDVSSADVPSGTPSEGAPTSPAPSGDAPSQGAPSGSDTVDGSATATSGS